MAENRENFRKNGGVTVKSVIQELRKQVKELRLQAEKLELVAIKLELMVHSPLRKKEATGTREGQIKA
jgi:hypothetical protein